MTLIGRQRELSWLADAVSDAHAGRGALVLLAGEAGVGKTHLAEAALGAGQVLRGAAAPPHAGAYGPVVAALRSRLRRDPAALDGIGPLRAHLAVLLPELGEVAAGGDRATLFEAVRHGLELLAPAVVLLDDLQWSDEATLELLSALAASLRELPILVVGAYRSDEVGRGHPLRRLRADLRRARLLRELTVTPLDAAASAALAERALGAPLSPALAAALFDRTQGVPFFVQELAAALVEGDRVRPGQHGLELAHDGDVPVPETVRDAVLLRTADLSPLARNAAEAAAVAGGEFPLDLAPGLDELLESGLIVQTEPGRAAFRHALVGGAIYEDIQWRRRRALHSTLAARAETNAERAAHWRAAGEHDQAVDAYLAAARELAAVHAHRDSAAAALQALDLWPQDARPEDRIRALFIYAHSAELPGELSEAIRALREAAAAQRAEIAAGRPSAAAAAGAEYATGASRGAGGSMGARGAAGASGAVGADGAAGASGAVGPDGAAGASGAGLAADAGGASAGANGVMARGPGNAGGALSAARKAGLAAVATTERRLAALYDLQGDRERALTARTAAAGAFSGAGLHGEAAAERLRVAGYRQSAGRHGDAVELAAEAAVEATLAERTDLRARALGLEGVARAKRGQFATGVETIRAGLSLALAHELTADAAELYQRLATALETAADYDAARTALGTAVSLCETTGLKGQEHTCLSCMAYVLRELGDWDQSAELCKELGAGVAREDDALVADGVLGSILGFRGDTRAAVPLLNRCSATAARLDVVSMGVDSQAVLGVLAGDDPRALEHFSIVLERWGRSEDHHYAVWGLRAAAQAFAAHRDLARARECSEALSVIAATTGHTDALSALAHALGETALAEGNADAAAQQITRALELQQGLEIPFERAQIALRAGVALAAAGEREPALEKLEEAYRTARKLQAKPLAAQAADEFARLGEPLEPRLGRRAAAQHEQAGLSKRELEVMRLVSAGRTNREIANQLFLSPRTVDMHVRNILLKLSCRTRTEAAGRAAELGLLA